MGSKANRPLSAEDREMWRRVTQSVRAAPGKTAPPPERGPAPAPKTSNAPSPAPQQSPAKPRDSISAAQLDGKLDSRLKRGRIEPERVLDLHGLSLARAEAILRLFVDQSRREGLRVVLVITGKGRPGPDDGIIPRRRGVLRDHLPVWVHSMGGAIVKTLPAHQRHGGAGAFYLYLRRRRPPKT